MSECLICGDRTDRPFEAFVWHFRFIDLPQWRFIVGNFKTFGFWLGLRGNVTLMFPFLNTLINWKWRRHRLVFPKEFLRSYSCPYTSKKDGPKS
jgi:hypothetical protein